MFENGRRRTLTHEIVRGEGGTAVAVDPQWLFGGVIAIVYRVLEFVLGRGDERVLEGEGTGCDGEEDIEHGWIGCTGVGCTEVWIGTGGGVDFLEWSELADASCGDVARGRGRPGSVLELRFR